MLKRFTAFAVSASMLLGALTVFAADGDLLVNEVFNDYNTNSAPANATISGLDAKIVEKADRDKAFCVKTGGDVAQYSMSLASTASQMVFSFDVKVQGDKVKGTAIEINANVNLFNFSENGAVLLEDKYKVGSYADGQWHSYLATVDFSKRRYSVYVDGVKKVGNRVFNSSVAVQNTATFLFESISAEDDTQIYLDNIRIYKGNTIWKETQFPVKAYVDKTVDSTTGIIVDTIDDGIYLNSNSLAGWEHISGSSSDKELVGEKAIPEEKYTLVPFKYKHFSSNEAGVGGYGNMNIPIGNTKQYVLELEVYPLLETIGAHLCFIIHSSSDYCRLLRVDKDGNLYSADTFICKIPMGKWTHIAAACDLSTGKGYIYVNRELIRSVELEQGGLLPTYVRFGMDGSVPGKINEIYLNRFKVYDGLSLRSFDDVSADTKPADYGTLNDTEEEVKRLIDNDVVFMTTQDTYFAENEKQRYSGEYNAYANAENVVMVSKPLIEKAFGIEISYSGQILAVGDKSISVSPEKLSDGSSLDAAPEEKDGILYLPIASFAEKLLDKYAYRDFRKFVLISDKNREYTNSDAEIDNEEPVDLIFRYLQFLRPSGEQMIKDAKAVYAQKGTYPGLLLNQEEIENFRKKLKTNSELETAFNAVLAKCDTYLKGGFWPRPAVDGSTDHFSAGMRLRERCEYLSTAYYGTGDTKYLDRLWGEVKFVLEWESWPLEPLYTCPILNGFSWAYSVLHDYLSEEDRKYFRDQLFDKCLDEYMGFFSATCGYSLANFKMKQVNWGAVTQSGVLLAPLAMLPDLEEGTEEYTKAAYLVSNALQSLEYPIGRFYPDGCSNEGIEYWKYYVESLAQSIHGLRNMCGTDYELSEAPGFLDCNNEILYLQGPGGAYNYGNYVDNAMKQVPQDAFLVARLLNDSSLMETLRDYGKFMGIGLTAGSLLWYEPSQNSNNSQLPLDKLFEGAQILSMRSSWEDDEGAYLGVSGGQYHLNSHAEKGGFVFDKSGIRWICDLGKDEYNVEGGYYYENGCTLYRKKAEGNNCLVINPDKENPGQTRYGFSKFTRFETKEKGAIAVLDLSGVYVGQVDNYLRGFYLGEDRNSLVVQDEIVLTEPENDIYSFLHTQAEIEIAQDGKSAILSKDGKQLKVEVICDAKEWKLEAQKAAYIFPEMQRSNEYSRDAYRKIAVVGKASGKLNISFKFSMLDDGFSYAEHKLLPISEWTIPDGTIKEVQRLTGIYVNKTPIEAFSWGKRDYEIELMADGTLPIVEATSENGMVEIELDEEFGEWAKITVTTPSGRSTVYNIEFTYQLIVQDRQGGLFRSTPQVGLPSNVQTIEVKAVEADEHDGNKPEGAIDGDLSTRWTGENDGNYLEVDLGEVKNISGIALGVAWGDTRNNIFDIYISDDKVNYTRIYDGLSSGTTTELEYFPMEFSARFVRYVGHGNSKNRYNSVTEFRPCEKK